MRFIKIIKNTRIMKKNLFVLTIFALLTSAALAQFPGGGPGGHPMGPPPGGFHGGPNGPRPPMGDRNQKDDPRSQQVKQKKVVRDGSTFKVTGSLRDSVNNEVLPFVNVSLLTKEDSTFVKGAASNIDGYFEVLDAPAGDYYLRVSAIGYQGKWVPVHVENNTAMGTIKLKPGATNLNVVEISAERPLYAMDGEKMIYNVSEDPSIQTGTTTDALQNAPGVEVDIEGNITLRGVSSVEIWVNDKPSKLTEENLKTYLETLPANALDRIETITNPSAKYATESEAVINIITSAHVKKNHFISFGANAASQPNVSPWMSYTWANERLTINGHLSGRFSRRENEGQGWSVTRTENAATGVFDTIQRTEDSSSSLSRSWSGNFSLNLDYEIDTSSTISFWTHGNLSGNPSESNGWNLRDASYAGGNIYEYATSNESWGRNMFGMYGGDYVKKFDNEGHNLRVSLFGNYSANNSESSYSRVYSQTDSDPRNQTYYKFYDNDWASASERLNARYNRPYSRDGEMSYGLGYSRSDSHRDYRPYLLNSAYTEGVTLNDGLFDVLRRYTFDEGEQDLSADAEWTHRWGGFTLELGMGATYTNDHFAYGETPYPDDTTYNFLTYNPSIHMSYRTKDLHNFKLNYSLRMRNPSEENLTRYQRYSEDSYSIGNRDLHASYTHNAEAGWTKFFNRFGSVGLEGYGRLSTGEIDQLTDVTDGIDPYIGRIINYSMPYNIGSSWRYGLSSNITYRPTGFFNLRLYANLYDYGYSMQYDKLGSDPISNSKWSYSVRLNMWTKVFNRYQIHASANYSSPTIGLLSQRSARYFVNCGVRADFFKRKMSAFVNVQDIFNWGYKIGSGNDNTNPFYLSSSTSRSLNSRFISAGLTFRFGKMELERNDNYSDTEGTGKNAQ